MTRSHEFNARILVRFTHPTRLGVFHTPYPILVQLLRGVVFCLAFDGRELLQKHLAERQLRAQAGMLVLFQAGTESGLAMTDVTIPGSIGNRQAFQRSQAPGLTFLLVFDIQSLQFSIDEIGQANP